MTKDTKYIIGIESQRSIAVLLGDYYHVVISLELSNGKTNGINY